MSTQVHQLEVIVSKSVEQEDNEKSRGIQSSEVNRKTLEAYGKRRDIVGDRRREGIVQSLTNLHGRKSVKVLAQEFGTSEVTIRRDLLRLEQAGRITRTYGGATLRQVPAEVPTNTRRVSGAEEKDRIGATVAGMLWSPMVLILDAGTTAERVAAHLHDAESITVVTNGVGAIRELIGAPQHQVIVLGGQLRVFNETISGRQAEDMLENIFADVACIGCDAINPQLGIASRTFDQAKLKEKMMRRSEEVWIVAQAKKAGRGDFNFWTPFPRSWTLITDAALDESVLGGLRTAGLSNLVVAEGLSGSALVQTE